MKTIMKQWFGKVHGAFFAAMMFVIALFFGSSACQSGVDDLPPEEEQPELPMVQRRLDNERLIALAVCSAFDGNGLSTKGSSHDQRQLSQLPIKSLSADDQIFYLKYDFDFVQINDAVYFVAPDIDFPFLNELCGEGEIEVFLTSFNTFVYADETKDINHLQPYISDKLIVFRGEWGIYSCMDNGMSLNIMEYSSHKRFGETSIEKDLTPPIYNFFVKIETDETFLACGASNFIGLPPDQSVQWTTLYGGEVMSSNDLFSAEDVADMPKMSQQCTITEVGEDYFVVNGEYNLEKIYFDEYTLFFIDDQSAEATGFTKGDEITVSYDQLYERYKPKVVLANIITK